MRLPMLIVMAQLAMVACSIEDAQRPNLVAGPEPAEVLTPPPTHDPSLEKPAIDGARTPTPIISPTPTAEALGESTPSPTEYPGESASAPDEADVVVATPTATVTAPPEATSTATATPLPTATPSPSPAPTPSSAPSATPSAIPSPTPPATAVVVAPSPTPTATAVVAASFFSTRSVGATLPGDTTCATAVRSAPLPETHPANGTANATIGGPGSILIDGAHGFRGDSLAGRISGNFTGTTAELIRWAACKWGFDEDITRARVWTESSWNVHTEGDSTSDPAACSLIGLTAPCSQSYGLLQVKGTVHENTYPYSRLSSAWGLDYAMAWQRACYEGAFTWLDHQGYQVGDEWGCVGAWFSGEWRDGAALGYIAEVMSNLNSRPWQ